VLASKFQSIRNAWFEGFNCPVQKCVKVIWRYQNGHIHISRQPWLTPILKGNPANEEMTDALFF